MILLFFAGFLSLKFTKEKYFSQIENENGRTNFLLLGINNNDPNGKNITDTMIFVSLNQNTGKVVLISLPRDIWIEEIKAKINAAYNFGGSSTAKRIVGDVLGQKINYAIVLNFDGFEKAVDILGGIEINVKNSFDDYLYPIAGKENDLCNGDKTLKCRYEYLHFDAGVQMMYGKTALKYVRSRHSEGEEGTDFARVARQQQFLQAFKEKLLSSDTYKNKEKLKGLYQVYKDYTLTDIKENQYGRLAILAANINWKDIKSSVLSEDLFVNPKTHYSRQWVLLPKNNSWEEIHRFVSGLLN